METKDLVLLMLVPAILIGLVVYTDKGQVITGAVTSQQEESNIIGTYSVVPSFKTKIGYDLDDYKRVKQQLDFIITCAKENNVEQCMKQAESMDSDFEWALGCDKGAEKVLYDFAEFYQSCFESDDDSCLCSRTLELTKEEIQEYGLSNKEYRMDLTQDIPSQKIKIKMASPTDLSYTISINGRSVWYPDRYILAYNSDKLLSFNLFFRDELSGATFSFGPVKDVALYKNQLNEIKSVDFVEKEGDELVYPNRDRIKPENLHPCKLKPKNIYKFCVTKKEPKFIVYDKTDEQVKERPVTIKFASYIPTKQTKTI